MSAMDDNADNQVHAQPTPVSVTVALLSRYEAMLANQSFPDVPPSTGAQHLRWMCATARQHAHSWPIDKTSRWLGFVQAILVMRGVACVEEERNFSRPLFHSTYANPPTTVERTEQAE